MMEKLSQMSKRFFKFLLKQPVASVPIQNPTLSPSRSVTTKAHKVSIIPKEARRRHRSGSFREPSSPKVSCMGQVQSKKKRKAQKKRDSVPCHEKKKKVLPWIFKGSGEGTIQSGRAFVSEEKAVVKVPSTRIAPSLGATKKFVGGRGSSLSGFDVAPLER